MLQGEGRSVSPVPSHWGAGRLAKRKADRETVEGGEWGVGSGELNLWLALPLVIVVTSARQPHTFLVHDT